MSNLIAYIPVLNQQHVKWFRSHWQSYLWLITKEIAEDLLPRLKRNVGALDDVMMKRMIEKSHLTGYIDFFSGDMDELRFSGNSVWKNWVLPDEDISHALAEKYLVPKGFEVTFENIHARWDMKEVIAAQPVIPDCDVSRSEIDIFRTKEAQALSQRSPDWWRQIGAMAFRGSELLAVGWNKHYPTEYETCMFGDTRLNFDAGDPAGMDAYLSLHAEEYLIAFCARQGISLEGASLVINTFPCGRCARAVAEAGIAELFFREGSSFLKGFEILKEASIRIVQVRNDPESA